MIIEPANLSVHAIPNSISSLRSVRDRFVFVFGVIAALVLSGNVFSQTSSTGDDKVSKLLAEIESNNRTRTIYSLTDKLKIAEIEFDSGFKILKSTGKWSTVEFNQNTVPGWVSSKYVTVSRGRVQVNANNLNVRLKPSLKSPILLRLEQGHNSPIIARKNGFVRILVPKEYRVAIYSGGEKEAKKTLYTAPAATSVRRPSNSQVSNSVSEPMPSAKVTQKASSDVVAADGHSVKPTKLSHERLHVISPGDAVSLLVFGESDLSIENVRVPQSGRVSFPLIGSVLAAGKTTREIEVKVAELLSQGYVKNARISVTIFSYRPIFIRGAVNRTGSFPFSEGLTVGTMITLAGGSKKSARKNGVSILRDGKVVEDTLPLDSLVEIQSGDVISIEEEIGVQESNATYIYLHGEVASPGEYQYRRGLTVEKAIVLAGGFTLRGSRKKIEITRYVEVVTDEEPNMIKKAKLYTPIMPGDVIKVGATWF
jgi:polysaccharide export outer membrane protein